MSTRSLIGMVVPKGIKSIYCHYDGYLEGVGRKLVLHYSNQQKIEALMALGDLSSLREHVAPPQGVSHSYGDPAKGVCVAYGRDRLEHDTEARNCKNLSQFLSLDRWQEYAYLWTGSEWRYSTEFNEKSIDQMRSLNIDVITKVAIE